jgi:TolA-binding protein
MRDPPARPAADIAEQVRRLQQEVERLRTASQRVEELQKQVDGLINALNEARAKIAKLEGTPPPAPIRNRPAGGAELPGRTPSDPELVSLMRSMIQPTNDEARVRDLAAQMKKWAGDDPARKTDLAEFCKRIVHLKYGTEAAQKVLKQMAGD